MENAAAQLDFRIPSYQYSLCSINAADRRITQSN
jgi:hypothetical protein